MPGIVVEPQPCSVITTVFRLTAADCAKVTFSNRSVDFHLTVVQPHKPLPAILDVFQLGLLLEGTVILNILSQSVSSHSSNKHFSVKSI